MNHHHLAAHLQHRDRDHCGWSCLCLCLPCLCPPPVLVLVPPFSSCVSPLSCAAERPCALSPLTRPCPLPSPYLSFLFLLLLALLSSLRPLLLLLMTSTTRPDKRNQRQTPQQPVTPDFQRTARKRIHH